VVNFNRDLVVSFKCISTVDIEYFKNREKERKYKRKKAISTNAAAQLKYYAL
jgi:hypothetical protein